MLQLTLGDAAIERYVNLELGMHDTFNFTEIFPASRPVVIKTRWLKEIEEINFNSFEISVESEKADDIKWD